MLASYLAGRRQRASIAVLQPQAPDTVVPAVGCFAKIYAEGEASKARLFSLASTNTYKILTLYFLSLENQSVKPSSVTLVADAYSERSSKKMSRK